MHHGVLKDLRLTVVKNQYMYCAIWRMFLAALKHCGGFINCGVTMQIAFSTRFRWPYKDLKGDATCCASSFFNHKLTAKHPDVVEKYD